MIRPPTLTREPCTAGLAKSAAVHGRVAHSLGLLKKPNQAVYTHPGLRPLVVRLMNTPSLSRVSCDPAACWTAPVAMTRTGLMLIFSLALSAAAVMATEGALPVAFDAGVKAIDAASAATHTEIVIKKVK